MDKARFRMKNYRDQDEELWNWCGHGNIFKLYDRAQRSSSAVSELAGNVENLKSEGGLGDISAQPQTGGPRAPCVMRNSIANSAS